MSEETKPGVSTTEGPTAGAKPAAPADGEKAKKGPGRPAGAKNKPKAKPAPSKRRKAPDEYKDTLAAEKRLRADLNLVRQEHNKNHPTARWSSVSEPGKEGPPPPVVPADVMEEALAVSFDMVGKMWAVDGRPDKGSVKACAKSWSKVSGYFVEDPKHAAIFMAGYTTFGCMLPMWMEKKANEKGEPINVTPPKGGDDG